MSSELAVCLCSSFLGFFSHAGFLAGLHELGIRPVRLAGSSAGAIVAAMAGAGMSPQKIIERLLRRDVVFCLHNAWTPIEIALFAVSLGSRGGILSGDWALRKMRREFGARRIEDCREPSVEIAVTNLTGARCEIVREGPLADFVVASCAIPGICRPKRIGDSEYLDGGIANPDPFDHWILDKSIKTILIHKIVTPEERAVRRPRRQRSAICAFHLSHQASTSEIGRLKREAARTAGVRVVELVTEAGRPSVMTLRGRMECIAAGRKTVLDSAGAVCELAQSV